MKATFDYHVEISNTTFSRSPSTVLLVARRDVPGRRMQGSQTRESTLSDNVLDVLTKLRKADIEKSYREAPENDMQKQLVLNWAEGQIKAKK